MACINMSILDEKRYIQNYSRSFKLHDPVHSRVSSIFSILSSQGLLLVKSQLITHSTSYSPSALNYVVLFRSRGSNSANYPNYAHMTVINLQPHHYNPTVHSSLDTFHLYSSLTLQLQLPAICSLILDQSLCLSIRLPTPLYPCSSLT